MSKKLIQALQNVIKGIGTIEEIIKLRRQGVPFTKTILEENLDDLVAAKRKNPEELARIFLALGGWHAAKYKAALQTRAISSALGGVEHKAEIKMTATSPAVKTSSLADVELSEDEQNAVLSEEDHEYLVETAAEQIAKCGSVPALKLLYENIFLPGSLKGNFFKKAKIILEHTKDADAYFKFRCDPSVTFDFELDTALKTVKELLAHPADNKILFDKQEAHELRMHAEKALPYLEKEKRHRLEAFITEVAKDNDFYGDDLKKPRKELQKDLAKLGEPQTAFAKYAHYVLNRINEGFSWDFMDPFTSEHTKMARRWCALIEICTYLEAPYDQVIFNQTMSFYKDIIGSGTGEHQHLLSELLKSNDTRDQYKKWLADAEREKAGNFFKGLRDYVAARKEKLKEQILDYQTLASQHGSAPAAGDAKAETESKALVSDGMKVKAAIEKAVQELIADCRGFKETPHLITNFLSKIEKYRENYKKEIADAINQTRFNDDRFCSYEAYTILILAAQSGRVALVRMLLELGAIDYSIGCLFEQKENGVPTNSIIPVHALTCAVLGGHSEVVACLLTAANRPQRVEVPCENEDGTVRIEQMPYLNAPLLGAPEADQKSYAAVPGYALLSLVKDSVIWQARCGSNNCPAAVMALLRNAGVHPQAFFLEEYLKYLGGLVERNEFNHSAKRQAMQMLIAFCEGRAYYKTEKIHHKFSLFLGKTVKVSPPERAKGDAKEATAESKGSTATLFVKPGDDMLVAAREQAKDLGLNEIAVYFTQVINGDESDLVALGLDKSPEVSDSDDEGDDEQQQFAGSVSPDGSVVGSYSRGGLLPSAPKNGGAGAGRLRTRSAEELASTRNSSLEENQHRFLRATSSSAKNGQQPRSYSAGAAASAGNVFSTVHQSVGASRATSPSATGGAGGSAAAGRSHSRSGSGDLQFFPEAELPDNNGLDDHAHAGSEVLPPALRAW